MEASDKFRDIDGGPGSWADAESRDSTMVSVLLALAVEAVVVPTDRHSGSWERQDSSRAPKRLTFKKHLIFNAVASAYKN